MFTRFYSLGLLLALLSLSFFDLKEPESSLRKGKDHALFIAVKDYDEWGDLRNPISDAEAIAKELSEEYDFQTEILRNPTLLQIYQKLQTYQKKVFPDDSQLLVFFTGHGEFIRASSEGYFIPRDGKLNDPVQASYFPLTRIKRMVNNINCNHILLAIDACYSGVIDDNIALDKGKLGQRPGETDQTNQQIFIQKALKHKTRLYITSGEKERTPDGVRYSPFTEYFLKALRNYRNKVITFWDLLATLKKATPTPHFGEFGHHDPGGNFLFINNAEPASAKRLPRDPTGRTYKTVELNGRTWLAENLAYDIGEGSWCYEDKMENCQEYGRLYNWNAAKKACAALGKGWRLPSDEEWKELAKSFGGFHDYKTKRNIVDPKKSYQSLLKNGSSGFSALLGGFC